MTKMQKDHLKKTLKIIGAILYCITCLTFAVIGSETQNWMLWVSLAMTCVLAVPIAFMMVYVPIATAVWHWRLMGACDEEWQAQLLSKWWFFISRSEKWCKYLKEEIEDNYHDEVVKQTAIDFLHALARVKKPKWL